MTLFEKISTIYPELALDENRHLFLKTIILQNDGDGDYIKEWNHPTLEKPTDEQLKGL